MKQTRLTDGTGRWFDRDKALSFDETHYWDGHNHVGSITHTQYNHQRLYRTVGGMWILHTYSSYQGARDTYMPISKMEATEWFMENDLTVPDELSPQVQALEIV